MTSIKSLLKQAIDETPFYYFLHDWLARRKMLGELEEWEKSGKPLPTPHLAKQRSLQSYANRFELRILVETGTFRGDMVEAMKNSFERIYSIEIGKDLFEKAKRRFNRDKHVELINGNSGVELRKVLKQINQPTLFWIDAHYSLGETAGADTDPPIHKELQHIFNAPDLGHVIIIDDAHNFGTKPGYPALEQFIKSIRSKRSNTDIIVQDDMIRITPK